MAKDGGGRSFAIAGAIMLAAVAARAALDRVLPQTPPFITLYPAVALAGLLCGPLAAAAGGLAGVAAADYFWISPRMSFGPPSLTDGVAIALFVAASAVILRATGTLRAQLNAASVAKYALDLGLAAGGVGTWECDLGTGRITASRAAYALHGLPEGSQRTTPEDWLRGVHPDDAAAARATLQAAIADGSVASYTYRIFGASGGPRWISARGGVVAAGGDRRLLCALVDVTEQVRAQYELRRERERLQLALEAGSLAVWEYRPGGQEATIDSRYAAMMGFDPGVTTVTRARIGERIHPEDRRRVAVEHEATIRTGSEYHIEYRIVTPAGDLRWVVSQGILIKDGSPSDPGRMVGVIRDITDRKRREDDLRELAASRELLVREADHRIKNSLQLVVSLLRVQLRGITDPGAVAALQGAITRVGAIAASHLALQGSADLKEVDLADTLKQLCDHFAQLHPAITVVCRSSAVLMLDADRAIPLGLVVSEILTNALRHAFPDRAAGMATVDAWREEGTLVVRVTDDGVGMNSETGGGGLGSRIIRSLSAQLGAETHVDSTPGVGTVVTLRLPLEL
jgi:PAS domain S-box-containing protein